MTDTFSWLVEDPTPILILGGIGAAIFAAVVFFTGRVVYLTGAGIALAVMGMALLTDYLVITDRERIEDVIAAGAAAMEANRVDDVLKLVSPKATKLHELARSTMQMVTFQRIRVTTTPKITINPLTSPKSAEASFTAVADVKGAGFGELKVPRRVEIKFEWQDDRWIVTDAKWHSFLGEEAGENGSR